MSLIKGLTRDITENIASPLLGEEEVDTFSPLDQNPLLYFDGENVASLPAVNPAEDVFDLSANSNDLDQTIADSKPSLVTHSGFRGIKGDAVDDYIDRSDALGLTGSPAMTGFFVFGYDIALPADLQFFFGLGGAGNHNRMGIGKESSANGNKVVVAHGGTSIRFSSVITADIQLITYNRPAGGNHDSTRIWRNGVEGTRETSNTNALTLLNDQCALLDRVNTGVQPTNGIVFSTPFYNETFSDEDRQQIENFFINKYGL